MTALAEIPAPEAAPASPARLVVRELSLSRNGRILLDDVGLELAAGELLLIFGPPGAGKAAIIEWLVGLIRADRGCATLDGLPLGPKGRAARGRIGLVLDEPSLDPELTCAQNLRLAGRLHGLARRELGERVRDLLAFFELEEQAEDAVGELPEGQARRLELARALLHDPSLLLLCAPLRGLAPRAARRTWERFAALRQQRELSILWASSEASDATHADRVAILDRGRVIATDTLANLLNRVPGDILELQTDEPERLAQDLAEGFDLTPRVEAEADRVLLAVDRGHELIPVLADAFGRRRFATMRLRPPDLTDVFAHLTGRAFTEAR